MSEQKTKIDGYAVELEVVQEDHGPVSQCFISKKTRAREYTASLECLMATGELLSTSAVHDVHPQTIDAIEAWAIENGY